MLSTETGAVCGRSGDLEVVEIGRSADIFSKSMTIASRRSMVPLRDTDDACAALQASSSEEDGLKHVDVNVPLDEDEMSLTL